MSFSYKHLFVLIFVFVVVSFVTFYSVGSNQLKEANTTINTPPKIIPISKEVREVPSPDGTMNLIMETLDKGEGAVDYSFFVASGEGKDKKPLFTAKDKKNTFSLSQNAWSPDNTYLYLLRKENGLQNALVFRANGEEFSLGKPYLALLPVFTKRITEYVVSDVTGWDSPTLLHVNTRKDALTKGPSFWFEIPSTALLQLY